MIVRASKTYTGAWKGRRNRRGCLYLLPPRTETGYSGCGDKIWYVPISIRTRGQTLNLPDGSVDPTVLPGDDELPVPLGAPISRHAVNLVQGVSEG